MILGAVALSFLQRWSRVEVGAMPKRRRWLCKGGQGNWGLTPSNFVNQARAGSAASELIV